MESDKLTQAYIELGLMIDIASRTALYALSMACKSIEEINTFYNALEAQLETFGYPKEKIKEAINSQRMAVIAMNDTFRA